MTETEQDWFVVIVTGLALWIPAAIIVGLAWSVLWPVVYTVFVIVMKLLIDKYGWFS